MKKMTLTASFIALGLASALASASVLHNDKVVQTNPHAQQNAQVPAAQLAMTEVKTSHLNSKQINPLFKVNGDYQVGTGTGYSIQVQH